MVGDASAPTSGTVKSPDSIRLLHTDPNGAQLESTAHPLPISASVARSVSPSARGARTSPFKVSERPPGQRDFPVRQPSWSLVVAAGGREAYRTSRAPACQGKERAGLENDGEVRRARYDEYERTLADEPPPCISPWTGEMRARVLDLVKLVADESRLIRQAFAMHLAGLRRSLASDSSSTPRFARPAAGAS